MSRHSFTRRRFLGQASAATALAAMPVSPAPAAAAPPCKPGRLVKLSEHLTVCQGPIQVGIIRDDATRKALLIDCGDGRVAESLGALGIEGIDRVLFTHHHRDQACGAHKLAEAGARIVVPEAEREYFEKPEAYWQNPRSRWHIYNFHPHHRMLAEPVGVDATCKPGQEIAFGTARLGVLHTPGHTNGSLSYLVEVDGRRVAFCGDLLYDHGRLWDLYSLQKGFARGKRRISDYHGFLGAQWELKESMGRLSAAKPHVLVPSHGNIVEKPVAAMDAVVSRLDACYDKYVAISALRHYFPELFAELARAEGHMPIRGGKEVPDCLRHFGTTWMLVSKDKAALVMDCGGKRTVETIRKMVEGGEIRSVEGLWVTHYHNDHVNTIPEFQKAFDCPCITDRHVAQVIADPLAWRLPCISPSKVRVDRATRHGESWTWREFKLTAYFYPGQTLYHAALLVERGDLRMMFIGDSHTPAGIDDYCAQNRCFLGKGVGFDRCLALLEELRPTHLFNPHVDVAFDFTPDECRQMRENLAEREELFGRLIAWDHPNYGTDASWVRCHPYEQQAAAGGRASLRVVVTNHSSAARKATCRAVLPRAWGGGTSAWAAVEIPARREGEAELSFRVPEKAAAGRYVVPIDVVYGDRELPQFAEAIVVV